MTVHGGGDRMDERLSDESMRITSELLAGVRREIARGCDPSEEEPDDHKAVRTIEAEAIRARASEAALVAEVLRLRDALGEIATRCEDKSLRPGAADPATLRTRRMQALDDIHGYALVQRDGDRTPPVCPKGHGPMIRVECCPKCAEDVPGVME